MKRYFCWSVVLLGGLVAGVFHAGIPQHLLTRVWHASVAPHAHALGIEGVIVGLQTGGTTPWLDVVALDHQKHRCRFDVNVTSVFQHGAVLNPAHLKVGQQVQVLCTTEHATLIAKTVEVLHAPTTVREELRELPVVNYTFGTTELACEQQPGCAVATAPPFFPARY